MHSYSEHEQHEQHEQYEQHDVNNMVLNNHDLEVLEEKITNIMNEYLSKMKFLTNTKGLPLLENMIATDLLELTYSMLD